MNTTIRIEDVYFSYRRKMVFRGLSADFAKGMNFIVGANGEGKTTLFRLMLGHLRPKSGRVIVPSPAIGYLPQSFGFPPRYTVSDFLHHMAWLAGVPKVDRASQVTHALESVDLARHAGDRMGSLSGGMLRRAGIAQALLNSPRFLLLDEPTAGLDPAQRAELQELLPNLGSKVTIVVSTHLLEDVSEMGGNVILIRDGKSRYSGSASDLSSQASDGSNSIHQAFLDLTGKRKGSAG